MLTISRRVAISAAGLLVAPVKASAQEPRFVQHDIGQLATLELPSNWRITNSLNSDMTLATRERLRQVPTMDGATNRLIFSAGRYEGDVALAWVQVYHDPEEDVLNAEAAAASPEEIAELDRVFRQAATASAGPSGFRIFNWRQAQLLFEQQWAVISFSYQRTGLTSPSSVWVTRNLIFNGRDTVSIIAGYTERAAYLMQPIVNRVVRSLRPRVRR